MHGYQRQLGTVGGPVFPAIARDGMTGRHLFDTVAWTLGYSAKYAAALRETARQLGNEWTPAEIERALWSNSGGKAGSTA